MAVLVTVIMTATACGTDTSDGSATETAASPTVTQQAEGDLESWCQLGAEVNDRARSATDEGVDADLLQRWVDAAPPDIREETAIAADALGRPPDASPPPGFEESREEILAQVEENCPT